MFYRERALYLTIVTVLSIVGPGTPAREMGLQSCHSRLLIPQFYGSHCIFQKAHSIVQPLKYPFTGDIKDDILKANTDHWFSLQGWFS